jgi:hypothetical protein
MDQFPIYFYTDFKKDTVIPSTRALPVCIFTEESEKPMREQEGAVDTLHSISLDTWPMQSKARGQA